MQKGLVTVVVPIYNTEKYLDRCIGSIVNQTYRDLEILLIDDESPDHCPQMCDAWAERDSRIRVFHKKNEGQGIARNVGIAHATGEYIYFVDSDDYIAPDTIEKAYAKAISEQAEVVIFGFSTVSASGDIRPSVIPPEGIAPYRGEAVWEEFLPELIAPDPNGDGTRKFYMSACMMLISMDVIQKCNWEFVSERKIISEDTYSLLSLFRCVDSVAVLPEALYYYCENESSFSRKYTPGRYEKVRYYYTESIAHCNRLGYGEIIKSRVSDPYLAFTIATLKQEMNAPDRKGRYTSIKAIIDDSVLQQVLAANKETSMGITRRVMYWAMRHRLFAVCYCLLGLQNWRKT
jgi:glycosyltransferase involved in cell wall biosynthesis